MPYTRQEAKVMSFATMYGSGVDRLRKCPVCKLPVGNVRAHAEGQKDLDPEHLALYVMES